MRSLNRDQSMSLDTLQSLAGRRAAAGISLLLVSALLIWVLLSGTARVYKPLTHSQCTRKLSNP